MKKIEPIKTWYNGKFVEADVFNLISSYDNLNSKADFTFNILVDDGTIKLGDAVSNGSISIEGQEYIDWSASTDINDAAYTLVAGKLNLVIIGEYVPPVPPAPEPPSNES
jgi:hypothetical protein